MIPNLPTLKILQLDHLILHEDHDLQRTLPLVEKLRAQGILRNPPIVMPLEDGSGRCMVLDGANRVTSLKEMGFPHIVAQVVQSQNKNVSLQTWNHIIWGLDPRKLIRSLKKVDSIKFVKVDPRKSLNPPESIPTQLRLPDGRLYLAFIPSTLHEKVKALQGIVNCYKDSATLDRTSQTLIEGFRSIYPDLTALVIFPRFDIPSVLTLSGAGSLLPTGITRFTVSPRVLHLNYPLHELSSNRPIAYKEAYLEKWVEQRTIRKGIRFYSEATFLFDE
jgi:L-serine kinase (ATP) / ParB family transcriptional regulator, heme-responsive regulator